MYQVIKRLNNKIEFALVGHLTSVEFHNIMYEIKVLCDKYSKVYVLIDAQSLTGFDKILLHTKDFKLNLKKHLKELSIVSNSEIKTAFAQYLDSNSIQFCTFPPGYVKQARHKIFSNENRF
jgi:hypothetical protein